MERKKAILNWSGGKDSTLALYRVLQGDEFDVASLLTTINRGNHRISMHGVRDTLLEQQATSLGIPLKKVILPEQPGMEDYNKIMAEALHDLNQQGFKSSVFGDIFLEDLKKYREEQLSRVGFHACFPLWNENTKDLILEFIDLGFKTITVCVKADQMGRDFVGRVIDKEFLQDLPDPVDPCGENGEFHTFVFDGPLFSHPIRFEIGEKVYKEYPSPKSSDHGDTMKASDQVTGFWYCDLIPQLKK